MLESSEAAAGRGAVAVLQAASANRPQEAEDHEVSVCSAWLPLLLQHAAGGWKDEKNYSVNSKSQPSAYEYFALLVLKGCGCKV